MFHLTHSAFQQFLFKVFGQSFKKGTFSILVEMFDGIICQWIFFNDNWKLTDRFFGQFYSINFIHIRMSTGAVCPGILDKRISGI
ncbi:Uncharacterised protein [Mycobacterium tuberculosis]|nr:Uncharacterised protein [Mycobacterium tuberculosis]